MTTGAMGTLGPLHQPAGGSVAAVVLTVLGSGGQWGGSQGAACRASTRLQGRPRGPTPSTTSPHLGWDLPTSRPLLLPPSGPLWLVAGVRGQVGMQGAWWVRNGRSNLQDRDPWHPYVGKRPRVAAGARHCTWGWPQSHCSPRSTKPFPHTGPPTRRSRSGAFSRQVI